MHIGITQIVTQSLDLYRKNARLFFSYILLIFVPTGAIPIVQAILTIIVPDHAHVGIFGLSYIINAVIAVILSAISFWFTITLIRVMAKAYTGTAVEPISREVEQAKPLFWPAVGVTILSVLAVLGGALLLLIPGIIFALWFAFSLYSVVIDTQMPIVAMRHSKQLVDGRWLAVCIRLIIPSIVFGIAIMIIESIVDAPLTYVLSHTDPRTVLATSWNVIAELIRSFVTLVCYPLTAGVLVVLYTELKKPITAASTTPDASTSTR